jgi:hypothetical protein
MTSAGLSLLTERSNPSSIWFTAPQSWVKQLCHLVEAVYRMDWKHAVADYSECPAKAGAICSSSHEIKRSRSARVVRVPGT